MKSRGITNEEAITLIIEGIVNKTVCEIFDIETKQFIESKVREVLVK